MLTDKQSVLQLAALLKQHGISKVVLCPGSRNIPLVQTFANHSFFECHAVTDERSAGFFAIGLAQQSHQAVAVCCTSGSALLNLHPAVCEAFYRQVPLLIISADRPAAWIGQMDGQTLPQPHVFGTLVKHSVTLPEVANDENLWWANRLINEALLALHHHGQGPVHINVPLSEPLFNFSHTELPRVRTMHMHEQKSWAKFLVGELPQYERILVVGGQMNACEARCVADNLPARRVAWLTEILGNVPQQCGAIKHFDAILSALTPQQLEHLHPDLVITFGGHIVSKRLKQYLRNHPPMKHWHVCADGSPADLFCSLTDVFEGDIIEFWQQVGVILDNNDNNYVQLWKMHAQALHFPQVNYSERMVVEQVIQALPQHSVLHLSNSMVVRLAENAHIPFGVEVECNRGVNGIEGSVSSAIGYAACSLLLNVLLVGDLSFFYDMNALWIEEIHPNVRVVVLNNQGGSIFQSLAGLDMPVSTQHYVTAEHHATAREWAQSIGFTYLQATSEVSLMQAISSLLSADVQAPILLEVMTDAKTDAEAAAVKVKMEYQ